MMVCYDSKTVFSFMKKCLIFCIICIFLISVYYGLPRRNQNSAIAITFSNSSNNKDMIILLWYWPFGHSVSLNGHTCWDLYKIPHCILVDQRSYFPSADVVVFHNRELIQGSQKLPIELPRPQGQRWAWMSLESPANNGNLQKFANIFNMTISYRRDADVTTPYGELLPKEAGDHVVEESPANKTSLVCWVVSNYQDNHKRSDVYNDLKKIVPVKVYGSWANAPLSSTDLLPTISRCYFYLAFENSLAKDYITEKLWNNAYKSGAVPIVLGPPISDYKAVAPNHSFIHVDEFTSIKEMGEFLQQLANDQKRYSEYFTWKQEWKVKLRAHWTEGFCKICTQNRSLPQHKVYSDLETWDKVNYIH
ncbi:alpha-(1,3)-fucosyltransferase 7 isoform X1 [Melanotaenia boesemani]|uniref:alpha-(1,3)-fucosyltransferase 7 isoform X1 n=1 Tax=Melanotaenia boesemani TaxID=1250792 RepID=UPI001C051ABE|nr:alpha-(1,3)-fucosyltransferase 7 isoform X1 [Melanotaenia boesemani]XP_041826854.1 alpha-(1,3)-fucosyltransferase 7 isoform X1 [Melanotaenia boesemani]XP_041826855.1 alpha-(1,3)-fucosyltransferase 7 isoform X1 [Melanotaenia boesemani]XP_041826856.1 alpha-(1,3)-fucosyltransferase 7 isoform X1 [Melanotaenia boesemani]XP_041826858.1 alpha-(1,3)-fucosyltransferase 7 isoform X1 [Melanotaenia boesemani]